MSRPNPLILLLIIAATAGIMAWLGIARASLMISAHEGDVYHLLDVLFRMERGLEPHKDFVTPLGILGFAPIVWLMNQEFKVGEAILLSQAIVAASVAIPLWYVAWSRLSRNTGYIFAAVTMITVLALTYGGTKPGISISMHYNRWAWAIAFLVIVLAVVPGRGRGLIDGLFLGLGFSALILLKATFFVALLPGVAVALLVRREATTIVVAIITGVLIALGVTFVLGFQFWTGYLADLLNVARSEVRPYPGVTLTGMISQPESLAMIIVALLTYFWTSRAGHQASALGLALLIPGVFYITYQNFGNDPKWLIPFAAILFALRPDVETEYDGPGLRTAMSATGLVAAVLILPSVWTMALSPVRHFTQNAELYEEMIPAQTGQDIFIRTDRARTMTVQTHLDVEGSLWAKYRKAAGRGEVLSLGGVEFPYCELQAGTLSFFEEISDDLSSIIEPGDQIFTTDILIAFWLFGAGEPLMNGAPWYYGDLSGLENADYVLVPKCTFVARVHGIMLQELAAANVDLRVVRDAEPYVLFEVTRPPEG